MVQQEPLKNRATGYLLKRYERNEFQYDYAGMKISADVASLGETQSFKATLRMKRDSIIWVSITAIAGIEVVRMIITPDSVKYVSKIPDNKHYYMGGFEAINDMAKVDLDFNMLQDILVGNAIALEKDEGKFRSEIDGLRYLLISKYKRKVQRAVGLKDKELAPEDTIVVNPNDKRYQKAVEKVDEENMIISRYWLEAENYRLVRSIFNDLLNQRTVEIEYSDFQQAGEQYFPSKCRLRARDLTQSQEISFEINKLNIDKTYDFPFEIPEDYERKEQ